jgi:hypothetical protein
MKELSDSQIQGIVDIRDWMESPTVGVASTQRETIEKLVEEIRFHGLSLTRILIDIGVEEESDILF